MNFSFLHKYFLVCKLSFQDLFEYRFDFAIHLAKYSVMILLMSMVWLAVGKEAQQNIFSRQDIISYYVFAAVVYSLSNFHPFYIESDIKLGFFTKYLMKPIKPFWYYFCFEATHSFLELGIRLGVMLPILWAIGFRLQIGLWQITAFILFLPLIFFFSFCFIGLISTFAFWIQDVNAIRWATLIVVRLLSGILIPLTFMPSLFQQISFYLPFEHLAFTPIQILQNKTSIEYAASSFGVLLFWSVCMFLIQQTFWRNGITQYEGTGI